jgi:hypothetical protein
MGRGEKGVPHSFVPPTRETERRGTSHLGDVGLKGGLGVVLSASV